MKAIGSCAVKAVCLVLLSAVALCGQEQVSPPVVPLALKDYAPQSMLKVSRSEVQKTKYPAIDFHNHITDEKLEPLIAAMDACNIRVVVNYSGGFGAALKEEIARESTYPGRFIAFANIDWSTIDAPDFSQRAVRQLEEDVKAGARGLKIFKELGLTVKNKSGALVHVDDPRLDAVWEKAGDLGIPVVIHVSDPDAFFLPVDRRNERYDELQEHPDWSFYGPPYPSKRELLEERNRVIARHPRTTFVGLHVANHPEDLAEVGRWLDRYPNLQVEIGARLNELGRQPYTSRKFFLKYADRIMFGIDTAPSQVYYVAYIRYLETFDEYFSYSPIEGQQGRWNIYGIGLPDDVLEKVYWKNAAKLLRLK
jgi:predicted TIM-barrel fold metal-dependent hydrolase